MNRVQAGTPGFYCLHIPGHAVECSEDLPALCIKAREYGAGALVQEIRHPAFGHEPFGFTADGEGLRLLAGLPPKPQQYELTVKFTSGLDRDLAVARGRYGNALTDAAVLAHMLQQELTDALGLDVFDDVQFRVDPASFRKL